MADLCERFSDSADFAGEPTFAEGETMKFDLSDLWYLLAYIPFELIVCGVAAVYGWPVALHDNLLGWFLVGIASWFVYDLRKEMML